MTSLVAPILTAAQASAGDTSSMESDFVAHVNAVRAGKGLAPLTIDGELTGIARRWASQMASAGQISHNPSFPNQVHADWSKLGENVGTGPDVQSIHDAFVRSAHHYANIVDPAFTRIGVGVVIGANGAIFTAHQFERLASDDAAAPRAAAPAPTAARAPRPAAVRAPARAAAPKPAAAPAPPAPVAHALAAARPAPAPVMPERVALALEQLQGRGL
ncbi:MAG: hypothetical protein QOI20_1620 [Acidimicrobiaceae bacterium]|nr:hypothetical protein [Acidimicrobiaceae bacterium]